MIIAVDLKLLLVCKRKFKQVSVTINHEVKFQDI